MWKSLHFCTQPTHPSSIGVHLQEELFALCTLEVLHLQKITEKIKAKALSYLLLEHQNLLPERFALLKQSIQIFIFFHRQFNLLLSGKTVDKDWGK